MQKAKLPVRQLVILCKFDFLLSNNHGDFLKLTGILAICRFAEPRRFPCLPWPMRYEKSWMIYQIYQMENLDLRWPNKQ